MIRAAIWTAVATSTIALDTALVAELTPRTPTAQASLRWSPKGAAVRLTKDGDTLVGRFALGAADLPAIAVCLSRSSGAAHYDQLWIDLDRDGLATEAERLTTTPSETRAKWWSSFDAPATIPLPLVGDAPRASRAFPIALWFVEDPSEPDAAPQLRWSRRGWHAGQIEIGGAPVHVLLADANNDGLFDRRDAWFLSRSEQTLLTAPSRELSDHAWLDGQAYRPVAIDIDGLSITFEPFDPGTSEDAERIRRDTQAADRNAPRAKEPRVFGHDFEAALAEARTSGKRLLVDFETTWCGPCAEMNTWVYTSQAFVDAALGVVLVKVDGDERTDLTKQYAVAGYPTIVVLESDGAEAARRVGYQSIAEMVGLLH